MSVRQNQKELMMDMKISSITSFLHVLVAICHLASFVIAQIRKERESIRQLQTLDLLHHCASDSSAAAEARHIF